MSLQQKGLEDNEEGKREILHHTTPHHATQIAEHFQGRIRLTFIPYAVVGHQQAYDVHRALEVVGRRSNPEAYYVFVDLLFANQSEFGNPQFKTKSPLDLLRMLAAWTAPEPYAISLDDLSAAMEDDATFDAVKAAQRRGISLGVWCTPTCYLNGSLVTRVTGTDETSTWIEYLEALAE